MKTHELVDLLDYVSKIMSFYPNKNLSFALDDILNILEEQRGREVGAVLSAKKKVHNEAFYPGGVKGGEEIKEFAKNIKNKDSKDIEDFLNNADLFPNIKSLNFFASELGIKTPAKQNRNVVIMTIIKAVERRRIDTTIGNRLT